MNDNWSVDFYSKKIKKITSFILKDNSIIKNEQSPLFQKSEKDLEKLELNNIKVSLDEALGAVDKIKNEKIPAEDIKSRIIILQQDKTPIWNISSITSALNLLNIKINATNNEIIEQFINQCGYTCIHVLI